MALIYCIEYQLYWIVIWFVEFLIDIKQDDRKMIVGWNKDGRKMRLIMWNKTDVIVDNRKKRCNENKERW